MGIRQLAMSPEPSKPKKPNYWGEDEDYGQYKPVKWDKQRYDGNYDGSKYKAEEEKWDKKKKSEITMSFVIPYTQMGKKFDFANDEFNFDRAAGEDKAKEIAYDKVEEMLGKGFNSKYSIVINAIDSYDEYEIDVILTPTKA